MHLCYTWITEKRSVSFLSTKKMYEIKRAGVFHFIFLQNNLMRRNMFTFNKNWNGTSLKFRCQKYFLWNNHALFGTFESTKSALQVVYLLMLLLLENIIFPLYLMFICLRSENCRKWVLANRHSRNWELYSSRLHMESYNTPHWSDRQTGFSRILWYGLFVRLSVCLSVCPSFSPLSKGLPLLVRIRML